MSSKNLFLFFSRNNIRKIPNQPIVPNLVIWVDAFLNHESWPSTAVVTIKLFIIGWSTKMTPSQQLSAMGKTKERYLKLQMHFLFSKTKKNFYQRYSMTHHPPPVFDGGNSPSPPPKSVGSLYNKRLCGSTGGKQLKKSKFLRIPWICAKQRAW